MANNNRRNDERERTTLRVRVQPGARRQEIRDFSGDVLRVSVTAPPLEGRANDAVAELLADVLGIRRRQVAVVTGQTSRDKVVAIDGLSAVEVRARLDAALAQRQ